jgi:hypothetical protein
MGRSFWFECTRCGYRAKVSGGADEGRDCVIQTIACRECRQLYDAVLRVRVPELLEPPAGLKPGGGGLLPVAAAASRPPEFPSVLNRLRVPGVRKSRWLTYKLQCPLASHHPVEPWSDLSPCPRCGYYLEKNPMPFRLWE